MKFCGPFSGQNTKLFFCILAARWHLMKRPRNFKLAGAKYLSEDQCLLLLFDSRYHNYSEKHFEKFHFNRFSIKNWFLLRCGKRVCKFFACGGFFSLWRHWKPLKTVKNPLKPLKIVKFWHFFFQKPQNFWKKGTPKFFCLRQPFFQKVLGQSRGGRSKTWWGMLESLFKKCPLHS